MAEVCVDTSFSLKLVLDEPERDRVRQQWSRWASSGDTFVAPWHWVFESHSVLRRKVFMQEITETEALRAWSALLAHRVRIRHHAQLFNRAWELASELRRPTTYDMVYLALADLRRCDLWTADSRLVHAAHGRFPRLHYIDELP